MTGIRLLNRSPLLACLTALLAVLLCLPGPAWAQRKQATTITLKRTEYQKKKRIEKKAKLRVGTTQTIRLEVSSGTAYRWEAVRKGASVGELSRKRSGNTGGDSEGGRPRYGRAIFETFDFTATKAGKTTLEFQLKRAGSRTAEATLRIDVVVSGSAD